MADERKNDSKEIEDAFGVLSLEKDFFSQAMSFVKGGTEPTTIGEAIEVVNKCIELYSNSLCNKIYSDPYFTIHKFVLASVDAEDPLSEECQAKDTLKIYEAINEFCKNPVVSAYPEIKSTLKHHKNGYLELLNRLILVKSIRNNCDASKFTNVFGVFCFLASIDVNYMKEFFASEEYIKYANRPKLSKGQEKRWNDHNKDTIDVAFGVMEKIIRGDKRLHDKIVDEEVHKFNDPITNPIKKKLIKKYPNKDIDGDPDMEKYNKEYFKLTLGKIISKDKVNDIVFKYARDLFGQANDPQKELRKGPPLLRRKKEEE